MSYEHTPDSRQQKARLETHFDAGQFAEGNMSCCYRLIASRTDPRFGCSPHCRWPVESLATKSLLRDESGDAPSDGKETGSFKRCGRED